jgi:hypothetical protein
MVAASGADGSGFGESAERRPSPAADALEDRPRSGQRHCALLRAVRAGWDREGVIAWTQAAEDHGARSLGQLVAAKAWGRSDAAAALAWIDSWQDPTATSLQGHTRELVGRTSTRASVEESVGRNGKE